MPAIPESGDGGCVAFVGAGATAGATAGVTAGACCTGCAFGTAGEGLTEGGADILGSSFGAGVACFGGASGAFAG